MMLEGPDRLLQGVMQCSAAAPRFTSWSRIFARMGE